MRNTGTSYSACIENHWTIWNEEVCKFILVGWCDNNPPFYGNFVYVCISYQTGRDK